MKLLKLPIEVVREAVSAASIDPKDREWFLQQLELVGADEDKVSVPLVNWPVGLLRAILDDGRVTVAQRTAISMRLHGMKEKVTNEEIDPSAVWDKMVTSPSEAAQELAKLGEENNCEIKLNGRWYIATFNLSLVGKEKNLHLSVTLRLGYTAIGIGAGIYRDDFRSAGYGKEPKKLRDLLARQGFRQVQTDARDHNLLLSQSENLAGSSGKQVRVVGSVIGIVGESYHSRLEPMSLGTREWPRNCVVEPKLEVPEKTTYRYSDSQEHDSKLPFVRMFSLDNKQYVFADIRDVAEYEYDRESIKRLALPPELTRILGKLFAAPSELLMSDIVKGKHGGLVILACGESGVGKTLTAEVYAEHTERPLYKLGLAELGTTVEKVEASIQKVFERIAHWNAVLLFDEIDVFLLKRGEDLERSAIVGVFLRLLDYYRGVMFMTTNRPNVLDEAIQTRITLKIDYPKLSKEARKKVWTDLFGQAGITYNGDFETLTDKEFNGRVIRNLVRLAKIMQPSGQLTEEDMRDVLPHSFGANGVVAA
jgi:hypothetical protein